MAAASSFQLESKLTFQKDMSYLFYILQINNSDRGTSTHEIPLSLLLFTNSSLIDFSCCLHSVTEIHLILNEWIVVNTHVNNLFHSQLDLVYSNVDVKISPRSLTGWVYHTPLDVCALVLSQGTSNLISACKNCWRINCCEWILARTSIYCWKIPLLLIVYVLPLWSIDNQRTLDSHHSTLRLL